VVALACPCELAIVLRLTSVEFWDDTGVSRGDILGDNEPVDVRTTAGACVTCISTWASMAWKSGIACINPADVIPPLEPTLLPGPGLKIPSNSLVNKKCLLAWKS
jgi:hypothetical protein